MTVIVDAPNEKAFHRAVRSAVLSAKAGCQTVITGQFGEVRVVIGAKSPEVFEVPELECDLREPVCGEGQRDNPWLE